MELTGFEPVTSCLQSRCSSQLSYSPVSTKKQQQSSSTAEQCDSSLMTTDPKTDCLAISKHHQMKTHPIMRILLRKEVIQPLVPQRLPCYDFIPVTSHTFGASGPCGFGQRLRVQPASMM